LPTYHLAPRPSTTTSWRVTLVVRGEEWISSVPLHHQLFDALGFPRIPYAHVGAADEAGRRQPPQALQAEGTLRPASASTSSRASRPRAVLYYLRGPGQRPARRAAAARGPARAAAAHGSSASPGRCLTWPSWMTSAPTTLRRCPVPRSSTGCCPWARRVRQGPRDRRRHRGATWRCGPSDVERVGTEKPRKGPAQVGGLPRRVRVSSSPRSSSWSPTRPTSGSAGSPRTWCGGDGVRVRRGGTSIQDQAWSGSSRSARLAGEPRLRAAAEGLQEEPGGLPRLDRPTPAAVIRVLVTGSRQSPDLAQTVAAPRPGRSPAPGHRPCP